MDGRPPGRPARPQQRLERLVPDVDGRRDGGVEVFGQAVANRAPERIARTGIALVPQGRRIFKSLSVRENLIVAARKPVGGGKALWTLDTVFDMFPRLGERRAQMAGLLSVADVGRTIAKLKAEGLSIVLVEQNIKLTLNLADEVVIINTGSVVFRGTPAELERNDAVISQHLGVF